MVIGDEYVVGPFVAQAGRVALHHGTSRSTGVACTLHLVPSPRLDAASLEHFVDEARPEGGAQSPSVLGAGYDAVRAVVWMVTEPVQGRHLPELTAEVGPLPLAAVSSLVLHTLDVLEGAHEVGRVHGALTPGCLFVESAKGLAAEARVTVVGFGAPTADRPSAAEDVSAVAALTFWALTGGRGAADVDARMAPTERLRLLGVTDVVLPPWFDGWFAGCVDAGSDGRFATASDAEAAWVRSVAAPPAGTSRARWVGAVAAAAALAVSAVAVARLSAAGSAAGLVDARAHVRAAAAASRCPAGMAWVPGGQTMMGSREGRGEADQRPRHVINITGFCLDATEVTVAAYGRYWAATGRRGAATPDHGLNCNWGRADRAQHPLNCVDWQQARDYCAWSGHPGGARALPTEAQWEFAARGPEGGRYPWGSEGPGARPCWSGDAPRIGTCPAGSLAGDRTSTGVSDLAGNVSEWTATYYTSRYEVPDAAVPIDPTGPASSVEGLRVFRGGSWAMSVPTSLRAAARGRHTEAVRSRSIGFRCARRP